MGGKESSFWSLVNAGWFSLTVGTVIGIIGIWLGYIFYSRSRQLARLRYLLSNSPIIEPTSAHNVDGLEVRFDGSAVPRVTRTSFGLWNDGTTTIIGSDIVQSDPLRLELVGDGQIFRGTVEGETRSVNGAVVSLASPTTATLSFDYLDRGDGFRVQILHSGEISAVSLRGTIRGLPKGATPYDVDGKALWILLIVLLLGGVAVMGLVGFFIVTAVLGIVHDPTPKSFSPLLVPGVLIALIWWIIWSERRPQKPVRIKGVTSAITEDATLMRSSSVPRPAKQKG